MTELELNDRALRTVDLPWPDGSKFHLTIDYECDYGTALQTNTFDALEKTEDLVNLVEDLGVPITVFIQTEVLDAAPEQVELLENADVPVSFHPHSHTHQLRKKTDIEEEIRQSVIRYKEFFGHRPIGYRFPNGTLTSGDYKILEEYGFNFDASVFPSWRPGYFDNRDAPTNPQYLPDFDLFEIPFTVFTERFRVPTALSYCRILGRPFIKIFTQNLPSTVVFNIHMHDLINTGAYEDLDPMYKLIYSRNKNGLEILEQILQNARSTHEFTRIESTYKSVKRKL